MWDGQNLISPAKFSGLKVWLDASQITGLNDGDAVTTWTDMSGNSNSPTQAAPDYRPIYKTNILNGLPVVRFDGVNDHLVKTYGAGLAQPNTVIIVAKNTDLTTIRYYFDSINDGTRQALLTSGNTLFNYAGASSSYYTLNAVVDGQFCIYISHFSGTASYGRLNKSYQINDGTAGTNAMNGLSVGSRSNIAQFFKGDIAELIVYNKTLSSYEIYQLENYLAKKWGIRGCSGVVADGFNRADNATSMGNSDSNQTWVAGSYDSTALPTIGISGNKAYFPTCAGTDSHAYVETGKSDCVITAQWTHDSLIESDKGIVFRRVDANNYFWAHADTATDTIKISRCLAGVRSDVASVVHVFGVSTLFVMRIQLSGDQITLSANRSAIYTRITDANLQTATKHGIYNASGTQAAFDYFYVEEA